MAATWCLGGGGGVGQCVAGAVRAGLQQLLPAVTAPQLAERLVRAALGAEAEAALLAALRGP